MRILITGRHGQVASCLAERWSGLPRHELLFAHRPRFDLEDETTIAAVIDALRPDAVVNAAAFTAVDQAEDEPERAEQVNARAPAALARAAAAAGARLIHLSTDYVFDGRADAPYPETAPTNPVGSYGRTKLAGERAVLASAADAIVVRTSWVYSPFGKNFVKTMLGLAARQDELRVVADQIGNPTSAYDIADGLHALLASWDDATADDCRIFHLAGSGEASWADLAQQVMEVSAKAGGPTAAVTRIASSEWPTRAERPMNSRLDCSRLAVRVGYRAPNWQDSLQPVVQALVGAGR